MFCEKCGSEIPESVICPKCGCKSGYIEPKTVPDRKDTAALRGMILGIISAFLDLGHFVHVPHIIPLSYIVLSFIVAIPCLIMSIIGLKSKNKKRMAIAGIICSCITIVLYVYVTIRMCLFWHRFVFIY